MKPRTDLALRERAHQRATLVAIGGLLFLATSPVFAHHLSFGLDSYLAGLDHLGALCVTALHLLFAPVHRGFHVLLVAGIAYATWDRYRAWRMLRRALSQVAWQDASISGAVAASAQRVGIDASRLRIVPGLPSPALTVGWVHTLILVAGDLDNRLSEAQLDAVLAHELVHLRRRDPLRLSILRFLSVTIFWIPALRRLSDDFADEAEILADDHAAASQPLVLATALLTLAGAPNAPAGAVGILRDGLLDRRVRRLAGESVTVRSHVTRRSKVLALAALLIVWTSGILVAHPLPHTDNIGGAHCEHHGQFVLGHLFCLGFPSVAHTDCPHQRR